MVKPSYAPPPHPIGYVELQVGWAGIKEAHELRAEVDILRNKGLAEHPGLVQHGARLETTVDGAGVAHFTLYMGFAPPVASSEPLDPHNMNDAPMPKAGWPEPTDGIMPLGTKEQKF
jgi:hypothetical protein